MAYNPRPTKKIKLVTNPEEWVEYYTNLTWGDRKAFREVLKGEVDELVVSVDTALERLVKAWSLEGENGQPLPITTASFETLDQADLDAIAEVLSKVTSPDEAEDKKKETGSPVEPTLPSAPTMETTPSLSS